MIEGFSGSPWGRIMSATMNQSVTLHEGKVFSLVRENVTVENGGLRE